MLVADLMVDAINASFEVAPKAFYRVSVGHSIDILLCAVVNHSVDITTS